MVPPAKPQIEHSIAKKKNALILDVAQSGGQLASPIA